MRIFVDFSGDARCTPWRLRILLLPWVDEMSYYSFLSHLVQLEAES